MSGQRPELLILRWAAGLVHLGPEQHDQVTDQAIDAGVLLMAALHHHVGGRLLRRVTSVRPPWATSEILDGLRDITSADLKQWNGHLQSVRELLEAQPTAKVVWIKGLATGLLLGQPRGLRDADAVPADPEELATQLERLGYERATLKDRHEFASLRRDNIEIELHKFVPIWHVVTPALTELLPERNPGRWIHTSKFVMHQLRYQDIDAVSVRRPRGRSMQIPTPLMAALICASHLAHDAQAYAFPAPVAAVRLSDAAELNELRRLAGNKGAAIHSLANQFGASDAIRVATSLMSIWSRPVAQDDEDSFSAEQSITFAQRIWFPFWMAAERDVNQLLLRTFTWMDFIRRLGSNHLAAEAAGSDSESTGQPEYLLEPGRSLEYGASAALGLRVGARWSDQTLVLCVAFRPMSPDMVHTVRVDFGSHFWELAIGPEQDRVHRGLQAEVQLDFLANGITLLVGLRWSTLPSARPSDDAVATWVGVNVRRGALYEAATLIPLIVVRPAGFGFKAPV